MSEYKELTFRRILKFIQSIFRHESNYFGAEFNTLPMRYWYVFGFVSTKWVFLADVCWLGTGWHWEKTPSLSFDYCSYDKPGSSSLASMANG